MVFSIVEVSEITLKVAQLVHSVAIAINLRPVKPNASCHGVCQHSGATMQYCPEVIVGPDALASHCGKPLIIGLMNSWLQR